MHFLIRAYSDNISSYFNDRQLTTLSNQKERILLIALGVFACVVASYLMSRLLFKDKFKQKENTISNSDQSNGNVTSANGTTATIDGTAQNTQRVENEADEFSTFTGSAEREFEDGVIANGEFIRGQFVKGTITFPNKNVWTGSFVDGLLHGKNGKKEWFNGTVETGEFKSGKLHGVGERRFTGDSMENGTFVDNELHGIGVRVFADNTEEVGSFEHGVFVE